MGTAVQLEERRDTLRNRLEDGYRRIEEAEVAGQDVTGWEDFWLSLLHEYEGICRELDAQDVISPRETEVVA